ncbi:MAG: hypothetical protein ICV62_03025 [Cyanobacteria bacterium Co-bin13]|nr:hypothetical protein [Cyanobacteria bacterium Co-bin13]
MKALRGPFTGLIPFLAALALVFTSSLTHAQTQGAVLTGAPPPLGRVIRQFEPIRQDGASAYAVWTTSEAASHQVWFRIAGGEALFRQRLRVYRENAGPRLDNSLPPSASLVQEIITSAPTGWYALNAERGRYTYYIDGDHRQGSGWENDEGVQVTRVRHENGLFFQIRFEDIPQLDDYDDLIVEVAFIQAQ